MPKPPAEPAPAAPAAPLPPGFGRGVLIGAVVLLGAAALCGALLQEPLEALGKQALDRFGLGGLGLVVLGIDSVPTPLSYAPVMLLAIQGGATPLEVGALCGALSVLAGLLGYGVGRAVGMPRPVARFIARRYGDRLGVLAPWGATAEGAADPELEPLTARQGALAVVTCGLLPLPFALGTWSAGALGCPFFAVALASLVRIPKTAFYIVLITLGLGLGAGR
jgi:hypothetical protein